MCSLVIQDQQKIEESYKVQKLSKKIVTKTLYLTRKEKLKC
jgi:hypothetical protein